VIAVEVARATRIAQDDRSRSAMSGDSGRLDGFDVAARHTRAAVPCGTAAVFDDTCGNLIQIVEMTG
jgi:hypothetical protein